MLEALQVLAPALKSMPVWVTVAVGLMAASAMVFMRARGANIDEHVSMSRAIKSQMDALVAMNQQLLEANKAQAEQIEQMGKKIDKLEAKIEELEAELREARDA